MKHYELGRKREKILSIFLIVFGVLSLVFGLTYQETPRDIQNMASVDITEIRETSTFFVEDLQVLSRYAFKTVHEYEDSESGYSDTQYYVYSDSQPMDNNDLFAEYYIVKFSDKTGTEYITSLSVLAGKDIAPSLRSTPVRLDACLGAALIAEEKLLNSEDEDLRRLRAEALDACARESGLPRAQIKLGYQTRSVAENLHQQGREVTSAKVTNIIFGGAMLAAGIFLLVKAKRKTQKTA